MTCSSITKTIQAERERERNTDRNINLENHITRLQALMLEKRITITNSFGHILRATNF